MSCRCLASKKQAFRHVTAKSAAETSRRPDPSDESTMKPSLRNRVLFEQQRRIPVNDPAILTTDITNIVFDDKRDPAKAWIGESTAKIGDWRAICRSAYMRWALIINAVHVADEHYQKLPADRALAVNVFREDRGRPFKTPLKTLTGPQAATAYQQVLPTISGYAIADLYGVLEEIVFDAYEIFHRHKPEVLIKGDEYQPLRRLYARRDQSEEDGRAWRTAWSARFDTWRRKRGYDGLHRVFAAYFAEAGLKRPSYFEQTDVQNWAGIIETIGQLRHLVTHGEGRVNADLAKLCQNNPGLGWSFVEGEELEINLYHLQTVEYFIEQLLTAINVSLCEKGWGRSIKKDLERFEGKVPTKTT